MEFSILNLLLVLVAAWGAGLISKRLGYPAVLGELLAGIVLGPPLLGLLHGSEALAVLAEVGILLMMLYIGMEIEPAALKKASKGELLAAAGGFITPFLLCYALIVWTGGSQMAGIFVGVAAGVTSLATKSRILVDLKLLDTRIAHVMMAGALVADTVSLIIFAAIIGVAEVGSLAVGDLLTVAGKAFLFFGAAVLIGLKGFPLLLQQLKRWEATRTINFMLILIIALLFAEMAELAGMHGILGAFLAGLFLHEGALGRSMSKEIRELVRDASIGFLAPVFFVTAGFAVSLSVFTADLGLLLGVIALATLGKIAGTALFYLPTGHGWREGTVLGAGMNGRGAVEIIIAQIGLSMGLISQEIFSILVFMAIATTAAVPLFLKWGVDWLRGRGELVREGERAGVLIVGAGPTARALGRVLARTQPVYLVDRNPEHCAFAEADDLSVVCGNALDEEVLATAQAAHVQHFIACTPNLEVNALVAQLARTAFHVPAIHILNGGDETGHSALTEHLHATTLFGGPVPLDDWDHDLSHDNTERAGLSAERVRTPRQLFRDLQTSRRCLPLAIRREDRYLPFHSGSDLQAKDRIIVVRPAEEPYLPMDRFDRLAARAPVLDIERTVLMDTFFGMAASTLAPRLSMDPGELAQRLTNRETTSSTVLLPGLAIPHVVLEGKGRFEMLIARCRDGVVFPGHPERVHAAFVLAGTADERTFHLRALAAIAKIVQWPDFEARWLTASDAETLRTIMLRAVRQRVPDDPNPGTVMMN